MYYHEATGKYLRLLAARRDTRGRHRPGPGAGAHEALIVLIASVGTLLSTVGAGTIAGARIPVWKRGWAMATHAGLKAIDGGAGGTESWTARR